MRSGQRAARGEHEHGHVTLGAEDAHDLQAVHLGQHEVQHDEGGVVRAGALQRLAAVVGADDAVALALQVGAHEGHDLAVVIDDQDGSREGAGPAPGWGLDIRASMLARQCRGHR